jgi:D-sedoheptulose 7-phosphate isomerase
MLNRIQASLLDSLRVKQALIEDAALQRELALAAERCAAVLQEKGRILFCGNGGSAADAQHLAAELSGRFYLDRRPLDAEALHVNSSYLTAVANDFGYEHIFSRAILAKGRPGDLLIAFSTSGNSPNVLHAIEAALGLGMFVIGFTGKKTGRMGELPCTHLFAVPSLDTPRIQEGHLLLGHILCDLVEWQLFGRGV